MPAGILGRNRAASAAARRNPCRRRGRGGTAPARPRRSSRHCPSKGPAAARPASARLRRRTAPRRGGSRHWRRPRPPRPAPSAAAARRRSRRKAARQRSTSTSTAAAWNEAQRSATSVLVSGAMRSASSRTAVLRPEKEKSGFCRPSHRAGKIEPHRIAAERRLFDARAAGIGQAEQFGRLVEGFADGVVDRRAEPPIIADAVDRDELAMAAGDQQQQIGKVDIVGQPRRQRMGFEMIDRDRRACRRPARWPCRWSARP